MDRSRRGFLQTSAAIAALAQLPVTALAAAKPVFTEAKVTGLIGRKLIEEAPSRDAFPLVSGGRAAPVWQDDHDYKGVLRAITDLAVDIEKVTGSRPGVTLTPVNSGHVVIVGTLGKHAAIDRLAAEGKLDVSDLKGRWESFVITTITNPFPDISKALIIAGSDKRGTIFGIYELSEQMGVSPWYWWADVPPRKRSQAFVIAGRFASGEPVVRYRGIFINDEAPCMTRWTNEKYGGFNSQMYTHMFELILRLRGNYLWPAMWDSAFNEDDPENPRLADEYGIVMGTSHHEPMMRAQKEWTKAHEQFGNGEWNYRTNAEGLRDFWRQGIRRNKNYDNLVTIGMRGDGDVAMPSAGGLQADIRLLETIMSDQRQILSQEINPDVTQVPQLWALFTEVQKYYDNGMKVPDDVTLLFTDDNVGNLRRLPDEGERGRPGGAGIYYHFDMHGGPYAYQWINTNPFPKIWEQMTLANEYGANRIWIVNVGDLKPLELPIEFFIRLGWNPKAIGREQIADYTRRWAERDFGEAYAAETADIVSRYTKYNGWRKPEMVTPDTYSLINYREAEQMEAAWTEVVQRAEKLYADLPQAWHDAFYQLVLHPAKASAGVTLMNISAGRNQLYARQGRASTNAEAARTRLLFQQDQAMSDYYNHQLVQGKWNHMMDQTHLGEFTWQPPRVNMMPLVSEVLITDTDAFGVAIEGDQSAWPDHYGDAVLPSFDSLNPGRSYFEVFAQGSGKPDYQISTSAPWILVKKDEKAGPDTRYWVGIDWQQVPVGTLAGTITVKGWNVDDNKVWPKPLVTIHVTGVKASAAIAALAGGHFASLTGPIAIAAAQGEVVPTKSVNWVPIPDYGREASAMTIVPVTAPSLLPPMPEPQMRYPVYLPESGNYDVKLVMGPVMDFAKNRGVRIAVAFDDEAPQIIDLFADRPAQTFLGPGWLAAAKDNVRFATSTHMIKAAGPHNLKVLMVDPGVVLEKIIISGRSLPESYFGPTCKPKYAT
ncbi:glycosyl hydrolase 115 family protein [Asticcacaulis sp. EMRT-3]|uniref:glycosyl hydrolase 115 family protein n=1 Tax=Asticcacaulis sp. EMRT-3 TaxID=3040349 RepID=UPI0024AEF46F|nr:glycosyl hydrolase 115 family protein [Asticcacaulis sp. EMRT-3]MDI7776677.1 glycosyl hydrolase 115 family protein [Asticcacaulis sp. EMRT-3]